MSWETPVGDVDLDNLEGFDTVAPGRYHVQVKKVDFDAKDQMVVDYEILHGQGEGVREVGKEFRDYFSSSPKAIKRALMFAVASGATTVEELKELQKQRRAFTGYRSAEGRHLKIEIFEEEYQGKKRSKCGFGIWAIDDPKHADIPVNLKAMESDGGDDPFASGASAPTGDENQPTDDPFGDIT